MKLSVAIASNEAPPSAFVVWRGFESSINKAADEGYHGVELALETAADVNRREMEAWLSRQNMEVSAISTGQVFAKRGLYFTHPDPAKRKEVIEIFKGLIDLSADFGQIINVGRVRGGISPEQTRDQAQGLFIDVLRGMCDIAAKKDVTIIVEPVNRYEINFINSVEEGAAVLKQAQRPNTGLMPDVFHMNIEDRQIGATFARYADLVKYVHFADSNRHAPGQGHLDFDDVFDGLKKARFDGWTAIEILPIPDPDTAARQAAQFILPRVERYNTELHSTIS